MDCLPEIYLFVILNKIDLPFCCYWSEWTQCPPCLTHFHAKKESRAVKVGFTSMAWCISKDSDAPSSIQSSDTLLAKNITGKGQGAQRRCTPYRPPSCLQLQPNLDQVNWTENEGLYCTSSNACKSYSFIRKRLLALSLGLLRWIYQSSWEKCISLKRNRILQKTKFKQTRGFSFRQQTHQSRCLRRKATNSRRHTTKRKKEKKKPSPLTWKAMVARGEAMPLNRAVGPSVATMWRIRAMAEAGAEEDGNLGCCKRMRIVSKGWPAITPAMPPDPPATNSLPEVLARNSGQNSIFLLAFLSQSPNPTNQKHPQPRSVSSKSIPPLQCVRPCLQKQNLLSHTWSYLQVLEGLLLLLGQTTLPKPGSQKKHNPTQ